MASHDLRAGSAKHRCLCSIVTWTSSATNMDALPSSGFPLSCCGTSIGHTSSHTTFFPFPESHSKTIFHLHASCYRFSALHCCPHPFALRPHLRRRAAIGITLQRSPSTPLCESLPTCLVETQPCLCRMTNLPISGPLKHYRQYRQQLAKKGTTKKNHAISTKNNIRGIKLRWKKYDVSMAYTL
jgi:hypothetical protein